MVDINPNKEVNFYGISERSSSEDMLDFHWEEIQRLGFTKIKNAIPAEELKYYQSSIDELYQQQAAQEGGDALAEEIGDADVIRCPLAFDAKYLNLAMNDHIHGLFKKAFGQNYILMMQNGILNKPDRKQPQTSWHRDLNYQHWVSSKPLVMNALFCLDDFTLENGGTVVLPGSHLVADFPSDKFILKHEVGLTAKAGDVLVMDSMVFHRTGYNQSQHSRRAVNHVVGLPFMNQQLDIPTLLNGQYADDPFMHKFLGYRWKAPASVEEWRRIRQA